MGSHETGIVGEGPRSERVSPQKKLGGEPSNIFYVHPYLGKIPILTNSFHLVWGRKPPIQNLGEVNYTDLFAKGGGHSRLCVIL